MGLTSRLLRKPTVRKTLILLVATLTLADLLRYLFLRMQSPSSLHPRPVTQKIFIASTHWNNEQVLRSHWNLQISQIATYFGPENIFVSVCESGSWDDSKGALRDLGGTLESLGVMHKIVLDPTTHKDEITKAPGLTGWVDTPRGQRELRRIPYLSHLRNLSLEPLASLRANGTTYDKILFLNDVVFRVTDVESLLHTNSGNYATACAMDFSRPPRFYDIFALRDTEGHEVLMQTWPYFRSRQSRSALKAAKPINVVSCWNGMVAMDAAPFYTDPKPLSFRGIPDSLAQYHLEGSECCLIHFDNPLTVTRGVFVNSNVRVGYSQAAYEAMKGQFVPHSLPVYFWRIWENRMRRWLTTDWFRRKVVHRRLSIWEKAGADVDEDRHESGPDCMVDEMQVLVQNGWAHL